MDQLTDNYIPCNNTSKYHWVENSFNEVCCPGIPDWGREDSGCDEVGDEGQPKVEPEIEEKGKSKTQSDQKN